MPNNNNLDFPKALQYFYVQLRNNKEASGYFYKENIDSAPPSEIIWSKRAA